MASDYLGRTDVQAESGDVDASVRYRIVTPEVVLDDMGQNRIDFILGRIYQARLGIQSSDIQSKWDFGGLMDSFLNFCERKNVQDVRVRRIQNFLSLGTALGLNLPFFLRNIELKVPAKTLQELADFMCLVTFRFCEQSNLESPENFYDLSRIKVKSLAVCALNAEMANNEHDAYMIHAAECVSSDILRQIQHFGLSQRQVLSILLTSI